jgi:WD40 repeat protein
LLFSLIALGCSNVEPSQTPAATEASLPAQTLPTVTAAPTVTLVQPTITPVPSPTTPLPSPTPTPLPSAEKLLEQALANLELQPGYHFEHVLTFAFVRGDEENEMSLETSGDFQAPASRQGTVRVSSSPSQSSFILSDDTAYWQYEEGGGWETGISPLQLLDLEVVLPQAITDMVLDVEGSGDDMRYHIQGTVPPEALVFFAYWYDEPFHVVSGELEGHYWIDPETLVPLEVAFLGTIDSPNYDLEVPLESRMRYSEFGLSVEIIQPHPAVGGHEFGVNAVAFYATLPEARFSPDGQTIIGTAFGELRQWDAGNLAAPPRVMTAETFGMDDLMRVVLSPDGRLVATTSYEGEFRLWRLGPEGPEPLGDPIELDDPFDIVFSPDSTRLAVMGFRDHYAVWQIEEDGVQLLLSEQGDFLRDPLAFHPDGRHLFVSLQVAVPTDSAFGLPDYETQLLMWDLDNVDGGPTEIEVPWLSLGEEAGSSVLDRRVINAIVASEEADLFLVSSDRNIYAWPLSDLSATPTELLGHGGRVVSLAISPDSKTLASGAFDDTILLWDLTDRTAPPLVLSGHEDDVNSVAFSPDGRLLLSASTDSTIRLWDMADPLATVAMRQFVVPAHRGDIRALALAPDGELLVSAGGDGAVHFWRLGEGLPDLEYTISYGDLTSEASQTTVGEVTEVASTTPGSMRAMVVSQDGSLLALGGGTVIEVRQLDGTAPPIVLADHPGPVNGLAFSPDNRFLASTSTIEKAVFLWDLASPQVAPVVLEAPDGDSFWSLAYVAFSPDGERVFSIASSFTEVAQLVAWSVAEQDSDPVVLGDCGSPYGILPQSLLDFCSGKKGGTSLFSWDVESRGLVPAGELAVSGHRIAYDAAQSLAASVVDGELLLWDLADPEAPPRTLRGHGQPVAGLVFTPDGRWLISAADDGTIRLWQLTANP